MGNVTRILHRVRLAYKTIATVLAVSFILHVAVALLSSGGIVQDDAISYRDIAKNVARGNGYVFAAGQEPTAWRAPAYPMFLAGVFKLTGDSETAARVANAFLWLGTNLLITLIAFALLEPASAMLACALAAFYPEFIGFSGLLWSESLSTFLFTAALATLVLLGVSRLWIFAILAGFFSGALILSRSTFLVLLFCIVVAGFAGLLKRRQAMAVVLIALAVVTPWSVRNYRLLHCFVLVESNATQNLYMGSRPDLPIPLTIRGIQQQNDPVYLSHSSHAEFRTVPCFRHCGNEEHSRPSGTVRSFSDQQGDRFLVPGLFCRAECKSRLIWAVIQPVLAMGTCHYEHRVPDCCG